MSQSPYIFEVTQETFAPIVLDNSAKVPVLVDFWAAWCAPCQMLMPVLAKLADEYQGQFIVAKVNSDEQIELARQYGIRSLPTLKLFRHGQIVDEIMGAQPESVIRELIDRHVVQESDLMTDAALDAYRRGEVNQAIEGLKRAAEQDPANPRATIELARILFEQGQIDGADLVLNDLPARAQDKPEVAALRSRLKFAQIIKDAPDEQALRNAIAEDPKNSEARYRLSARYVQRGEYESALEHLLEIVRHDRPYGDDAGRKAMLEVFQLINGQTELINRYRSRMFAALH